MIDSLSTGDVIDSDPRLPLTNPDRAYAVGERIAAVLGWDRRTPDEMLTANGRLQVSGAYINWVMPSGFRVMFVCRDDGSLLASVAKIGADVLTPGEIAAYHRVNDALDGALMRALELGNEHALLRFFGWIVKPRHAADLGDLPRAAIHQCARVPASA